MKTPFYLWLSLCCNFIVKAQENAGFTKSDTRAQYIPPAETHSTASIAKYIIGNYTTEREKLLAAYSWVTYNIKYNSDSMYVINFNPDPQTRITAALRRRKGVCENFAAIFNDIAVKAGLQSYEVTGYTKQYGSIDKTAHTWCAVYLEGKWFFCDPTWDVGISGYAKYFLVPPLAFIESHMPFDPLWQLLDQPVSHKEFYQGYIRSKKDKTLINFVDSINAFTQMNELQQLESAAHRINQAGLDTDADQHYLPGYLHEYVQCRSNRPE